MNFLSRKVEVHRRIPSTWKLQQKTINKDTRRRTQRRLPNEDSLSLPLTTAFEGPAGTRLAI